MPHLHAYCSHVGGYPGPEAHPRRAPGVLQRAPRGRLWSAYRGDVPPATVNCPQTGRSPGIGLAQRVRPRDAAARPLPRDGNVGWGPGTAVSCRGRPEHLRPHLDRGAGHRAASWGIAGPALAGCGRRAAHALRPANRGPGRHHHRRRPAQDQERAAHHPRADGRDRGPA